MKFFVEKHIVSVYDEPSESTKKFLEKFAWFHDDYGVHDQAAFHNNLFLTAVNMNYPITESNLISSDQLIRLSEKHGKLLTQPGDSRIHRVDVFIAPRNTVKVTYRAGESEKTDVFYIELSNDEGEDWPIDTDDIINAALRIVYHRQKQFLQTLNGVK